MKRKTIRWQALAVTLALTGAGQFAWAAPEGMPQEMHAGNITYVSGGVGLDESTALKHAMATSQYPLAVQFYGTGGEYLADVPVKVIDAHKKTVLDTTSNGPFMLVKLPPGQYTVMASHDGKEQKRAVTVPSKGHASVRFDWK